jgi:transglutaminase-like putative cysteine protease
MNARRLLLLTTLLALPGLAARAESQESEQVWHRAVHIATRLDASGLADTTQEWDVTAETPSAARIAAQQSFGFSRDLESVTVTEAYTRKKDGTIEPVDPAAILHQSVSAGVAYPSFSDWEARTIIFPDVGAGDTVHFVLHRRSKIALFPGEYENALNAGPDENVTEADITISAPAGIELHTAANHLAEAPAIESDGQVIRNWHLDPRHGPQGAQVSLAVSTFADYGALGDAYAAGALPKAAPTPTIRALAARLTAGVTDREAKARLLYEYVARTIRYVGLQLGQGRVVPHDADAVLHVGYGDCKDHVTLLSALLSAEDIPSIPALISTKARYRLPETPTLSLLDHVILYLPEFDLFADSTSPFAPFGVLPFSEYGKPVILVRPHGSTIARVPGLPADLASTHTDTELTIDPDGTVTGDTATIAEGPSAITLREVASNIEDEGPGIAAENQLRRLGTPGQGEFSFETPLELGDSYGVQGHFTLDDKLADGPEDHFSLPAGLPVLTRGSGFLVSDNAVDHGNHLCYAGQQIETIHLALPKSVTITTLPPAVTIQGGYASYTASYTQEANTLVVERKLTITAPHPTCTHAEYEAMRPVLLAAHHDTRTQLAVARQVTLGAR